MAHPTQQCLVDHGYPELANLMGHVRGIALFKQFAALNARSLLYQQAELLELEVDLEAHTEADRNAGLPYHRSAAALMDARENKLDGRQWSLIIEIREKLKDYNAALLQQHQIGKLDGATTHDLSMVKEWLTQKHGGDNFLTGVEDKPWRDEERADLVALSGRPYGWFTRWMIEKVVPWLLATRLLGTKAILPQYEDVGLMEWKDESYSTTARVMAVLMSTFIPSIAVLTLYCIQSLLTRIFVAMTFSTVLSVALALSQARTVEIFAATAALSSVQVVFIGSTSVA